MKSIIQHFRFPFSLLLLPVFLFGLHEVKTTATIDWKNTILLFIILHVMVYPSSNAYNSLQDKDTGSIGLVKNPLEPSKHLSWLSKVIDSLALLLSLLINLPTFIGVGLYILFSRLYSYRNIRLKQYPIIGFLTVFIFQGAVVFLITHLANDVFIYNVNTFLMLTASCLIGAIYPLSQIYQHEQDKEDGVTTISYMLGYRGTFILSGFLFMLGTSLFIWQKLIENNTTAITVFMLCQLPTIIYFLYWFYSVTKNVSTANFKYTMIMNLLSAICMLSCFTILILIA